MTTTKDEQKSGPRACPECGVPRALDQRYCLDCGARLGSLPAAIKAQFQRLLGKDKKTSKEPRADRPARDDGWPFKRSEFMPSPRAAAIAVIGMLGLGVLLGSATDQLAQSAGLSTILLESSSAPAEEEAPQVAAVEPEAETTGGESAPAAAPPPVPQELPPVKEPVFEEPETEVPEVLEEPPAGLPEIKHVFVIMLGENGYEESFGKTSTSKYLDEELPAQGELLTNYFAVTKGELANQIALLSGQGPTPETAADCPNYTDVQPGTESPEGQVEGNGCVYPAATKTLPSELAEAKLKWKAYVEDIEDGAAEGKPATCRHPALGAPDPDQAPTPEGPYVTWRNPFVYFHSIVDGPECAKTDVGLPQLAADLKLKAEKFPALAYISPSPLTPPEEFLKTLVPEIQESFAYKDGGMVVITSAQAPQGGEKPDTSGCCIDPAYPNLPPPPSEAPATGPVHETGGGGRVGALLLSPYVEAGTTSETYFNHYSLLVTIEELFGLERIGYGVEPALTGFDESIFNAGS
ncbi:MAG: alkaline phosphatase family protein [Solirubrobacterales bacterium]